MASPVRSPKGSPSASSLSLSSLSSRSQKWVNPCKDTLQMHPLDPNKDFAGAPSEVPLEELFHNVMKSAQMAHYHAQSIKQQFLNNTLSDPDFEESVKSYRQDWLPSIPPTSEEVFSQINPEQAFITAFEYMQYYAVGLEQIVLDQVLHDGKMIKQFEEVERYLYAVLCEVQLGMHTQNIKPKPDILRHVMEHQYRDIKELSLRIIRDYIILRDYITATNFIEELFAYHKSKVLMG